MNKVPHSLYWVEEGSQIQMPIGKRHWKKLAALSGKAFIVCMSVCAHTHACGWNSNPILKEQLLFSCSQLLELEHVGPVFPGLSIFFWWNLKVIITKLWRPSKIFFCWPLAVGPLKLRLKEITYLFIKWYCLTF